MATGRGLNECWLFTCPTLSLSVRVIPLNTLTTSSYSTSSGSESRKKMYDNDRILACYNIFSQSDWIIENLQYLSTPGFHPPIILLKALAINQFLNWLQLQLKCKLHLLCMCIWPASTSKLLILKNKYM